MTEHLSDPESSLKARVRREFWLGFWGYAVINLLFLWLKIPSLYVGFLNLVALVILPIVRLPIAAGMMIMMTTLTILLMWYLVLNFAIHLPRLVFAINPILCVFPGLPLGLFAVWVLWVISSWLWRVVSSVGIVEK